MLSGARVFALIYVLFVFVSSCPRIDGYFIYFCSWGLVAELLPRTKEAVLSRSADSCKITHRCTWTWDGNFSFCPKHHALHSASSILHFHVFFPIFDSKPLPDGHRTGDGCCWQLLPPHSPGAALVPDGSTLCPSPPAPSSAAPDPH